MAQQLAFRAMGCAMLAVIEDDSRTAQRLLAQVPDWFEEWEAALSRFREDSELSRLNRAAGGPVRVSPILWDAFQAALRAERMTDGLVTPTVLGAMLLAGYDRSFDLLPYACAGPAAAPDWKAACPLSAVTWDDQDRTILLPPDVGLDLGGSAKGWAADQAVRRLARLSPALVDAGGDIAVSGPRADGAPWRIGIADPFEPGANLEILAIERGGVATSGRDRRHWLRSGESVHHIIDPRTGRPASTDALTATVVAADVMRAEAVAKAAFLLGSRNGLDQLSTDPSLEGLLVLEDGSTIATPGMSRYLESPVKETEGA